MNDIPDPVVIGPCTLYNGDCLQVMSRLSPWSVDLVLCDLPYGTTQNKWDSCIDLTSLWSAYANVRKPLAAIALSAAQPFASVLVSSNVKAFRYEWIWQKEPTGNLNAKRMPMPAHEQVLLFYGSIYNPQGLTATLRKRSASDNSRTSNYGSQKRQAYEQTATGYPVSILPFAKDRDGIHPTQKPVALMEYLIKTYTDEGMTVLDNCMGSGTTGAACLLTGRKFIGIEKDPAYFKIACDRITKEYYGQTYLI